MLSSVIISRSLALTCSTVVADPPVIIGSLKAVFVRIVAKSMFLSNNAPKVTSLFV